MHLDSVHLWGLRMWLWATVQSVEAAAALRSMRYQFSFVGWLYQGHWWRAWYSGGLTGFSKKCIQSWEQSQCVDHWTTKEIFHVFMSSELTIQIKFEIHQRLPALWGLTGIFLFFPFNQQPCCYSYWGGGKICLALGITNLLCNWKRIFVIYPHTLLFSLYTPHCHLGSLSSALCSCQSGRSAGQTRHHSQRVTRSSHEPPVDSLLLIIQSWVISPPTAVEGTGAELQVWLFRPQEWTSEQGWTECWLGNLANWKDLTSRNISLRR